MKKSNNQQSTINNQQSTINNQQSTINNADKCGGLIVAVLFSTLILIGCDAAKPVPREPSSASESPANGSANAPPVKDAVAGAVDTSLVLDREFEEEDYGFRFNYPGTCTLERGQGIFGMGSLMLFLTPPSKEAAIMEVNWMVALKWMDDDPSKAKAQLAQEVKEKGGSLKSFSKVKLDGKDCTHAKVAYGGGMLDTVGSRISERYFLVGKRGNIVIEFAAPAKKFESYRPQFNAILKSFKFDQEAVDDDE